MKHHEFAKIPPMGWNSWDCFGASVTEAEVRQNAVWMAEQLLPYGWEYIVVDIQWYEPTANSSLYHAFAPLSMDAWSRLQPAVNRFPSAADGQGFKPLADFVHSHGLKFGIHLMRGIPRQAVHAAAPILGTMATARDIAHPNSICPWNTDMYGVRPDHPGSQAYYNSIFALYAEWGVDFVKVDDAAASRLYQPHLEEIALIRNAIDGCGRDIILSLSPGPAPVESADFFIANANLWRITDDFWDKWEPLLDMFDRCEQWSPFVGAGHWPDCDMLPLGHIGLRSVDGGAADRRTRFTKAEQLTMMSLWMICRSPLFFGGHLPDNDEWTTALLTNPETLELHRSSRNARPLFRDGPRLVWQAENAAGGIYAALFNLGDTDAALEVALSDLGLEAPRPVRDLWKRRMLETDGDRCRLMVAAHGAALLEFAGEAR